MSNQGMDREFYDGGRFRGARVLLAPLRSAVLPEDAAERNALFEPMVRAMDDAEHRGGRTLQEVAAQLFAAADLVEAGQDVPKLGVPGSPEALRDLAEYVANWHIGRAQRLDGVVPTSEELAFRLPQLTDMLRIYYGQDGLALEDDDLSPREGMRLFVDTWHPWCLWRLPHVAAECQEALAVFQTEEALEQFFVHEHVCGKPDLPWLEWLPLVIDVLGEHMRAHHPPHWVHKSR